MLGDGVGEVGGGVHLNGDSTRYQMQELSQLNLGAQSTQMFLECVGVIQGRVEKMPVGSGLKEDGFARVGIAAPFASVCSERSEDQGRGNGNAPRVNDTAYAASGHACSIEVVVGSTALGQIQRIA